MVVAEEPATAQAHDLLRLGCSAGLAGEAPAWVPGALARAPWVVVRRGAAPAGCFPVGVRGRARAERWGTVVPAADVAERVAPEDLVGRVDGLAARTPAAQALFQLRALLRGLPVRWGPAGSAGFELATGLAALREGSDLDIVVRADPRLDLDGQWGVLIRLRAAFDGLPARVDAQLDLGFGAVAVGELLSGAREVLVKTQSGPALMPVPDLFARSRAGGR